VHRRRKQHGGRENVEVATVEETEATPKELQNMVGKDIACAVMEVIDDKSLPKAERKALQKKQLRS
jgi:DNA-binding ferritin-like protein (Dps family)